MLSLGNFDTMKDDNVNFGDEVNAYLLQNIAGSLRLTEVHYETIHHYMDGLVAYRAYFYSMRMWALVDDMNCLLDSIAQILEPNSMVEYQHQREMYRPPARYIPFEQLMKRCEMAFKKYPPEVLNKFFEKEMKRKPRTEHYEK